MVVKGELGHRQRQAEATKDQIAAAARAVFAERGYLQTTIRAISEAAAIPVPTIYSAFGTKAKILSRITETWMREAQTLTLAEESLQAPGYADRLRLLAELNRRQLDVGSDIIAIYTDAARSDPLMRKTLDRILSSRAKEVRKLLETMADGLTPGLTVAHALDLTLALTTPEIYQTLVLQRGWSSQSYQDWLADTLAQQLLSKHPRDRHDRRPGRSTGAPGKH